MDYFWGGGEYLLDAYAKAYIDRTNREAWLNGFYNYKATEAAIINVMPYAIGCAMSDKVKHKPVEYPIEPISFGLKTEKGDEVEFEEMAYIGEDALFNKV